MKAYLDNGATTRTAPEVAKAMRPYFTEKYGNASSLHSFGTEARDALEKARKTIADELHAKPDEIVFTSGGTEADNLALFGIARLLKGKGNHIITSVIEHPAVMGACHQLTKEGFEVTHLNVDEKGFVSLDDLKKAINDNTILVTIMHANNEIGVLQDIEKIAQVCHDKGVLLHTDAVQSFTKVPIDVSRIPVDLVSISAHKIHGPKGIGALYVRKGTKLQKIMHGGKHEFNLRPGTENVAGAVGFAKAVEIAGNVDKVRKLRDYFIDKVLQIPDTMLNGDPVKRLPNNANISFKYVEGEALLMHLDMAGIAVSTGSACASHSLSPSHVLLAIGLPHEVAHGAIRFTLSRYTTKEELDYTVDKLKVIIKKLRDMSPLTR